jgi:hypothetical protein
MTVGSVGAVGSGITPVYATSPYLNGVRRTSDAAAAAALQATTAATSAAATAAAIAARAQATATVAAAPPFLNPAIRTIAEQTALGQAVIAPVATTPNAQPVPVAAIATSTLAITGSVTAAAATTGAEAAATTGTTTTATTSDEQTTAPPPQSPTDSVAYGDSGLLVQSYGAVALLTGPIALTPAYGLPAPPAVTAVAPVTAYPKVAKVDLAA